MRSRIEISTQNVSFGVELQSIFRFLRLSLRSRWRLHAPFVVKRFGDSISSWDTFDIKQRQIFNFSLVFKSDKKSNSSNKKLSVIESWIRTEMASTSIEPVYYEFMCWKKMKVLIMKMIFLTWWSSRFFLASWCRGVYSYQASSYLKVY